MVIAKEDRLKLLSKDENSIIDFVESKNGRVNQKDIVNSLGMSKTKVCRLLKRFNDKGIIFVKRLDGRTNEAILAGFETPEDYKGIKEYNGKEIKEYKKESELPKKQYGRESDDEFMERIRSVNKGSVEENIVREPYGEELGVEEKAKVDNVSQKDVEEIEEVVEEQVELSREKEQFNRLQRLEGRVMICEKLSSGNAKTVGMLTEGLMKVEERVGKIERLLAKAVGK